MPNILQSTIDTLNDERAYQDNKWGGPEHDNQHHPHDWCAYIVEHLGKALSASRQGAAASYRARLVAVAALAVAALEAHDRNQRREMMISTGQGV
jgi:hypothetical protein